MKTLIVGYGRMGKEVEAVLKVRNHAIIGRIDAQEGVGDTTNLSDELLAKTDVVIEFSLPQAVFANAVRYAAAKKPAVVGTTGWEADREKVKQAVLAGGSAYLWGSNFSLGAHIFFFFFEKAARLIDPFPEYDIMAYELHHNKKKDSPSGTALTLGKKIVENCTRKKRIVTETLERQIEADELHIGSVRGGSIPGTHTVLLDSLADTIEITHCARSRAGFALGAVLAAEWIREKKGFFSVEDFIKDIFT